MEESDTLVVSIIAVVEGSAVPASVSAVRENNEPLYCPVVYQCSITIALS